MLRIKLLTLAATRNCGRNAGKGIKEIVLTGWSEDFGLIFTWKSWNQLDPDVFWDLGGTVRGLCIIFEGRAAATPTDLWYDAV